MAAEFWTGVTDPPTARKGWVAIAGAIVTTVLVGLNANGAMFPPSWAPWLALTSSILTAVSVYLVPNNLTTTQVAAAQSTGRHEKPDTASGSLASQAVEAARNTEWPET